MVATLMVAAISCKETDLEQENNDRLAIESTNITLTEGETASVKLSYSKFDRGVYVEQEYDFTVNQHHLRFTSSDESVAVVSDEGMIQAVGIGAAKITATADVKVDGYVNVRVEATEEIVEDTEPAE